MLQNITNFFNLITGRQIKSAPEPQDLIPLGTNDPRFAGGYKPTAISVEDFINSIPQTGVQSVTGLNTDNTDPENPIVKVSVDGTTITGLGTPASPLVATVSGGGTSTYSNVIFVDPINGNNSTGVYNRFDKPFLTIAAAISAAAALVPTQSTRALIYIRRGEYASVNLVLTNYVDFYCEPGVIFTGASQIIDNGVAVVSNVYGSLKMITTSTSVRAMTISGASYCTIEFDSIVSVASAIQLLCTDANNRIIIKGNYIFSQAYGGALCVTVRYATNATINITDTIESMHNVVIFRFFTGTATVTCPNINLLPGNVQGGAYKNIIGTYDAVGTGKITINGNLVSKDPVNYGSTGSAILCYASANTKLTINGDVYGNVIKAIDGNTYTSGKIEINGNMSSSNLYTVWAYGDGQLVFKNSIIINTGSVTGAFAVAINGTAKVFFKNCYFYNALTDSSLLVINGVATNLVVDNCQGYSPGTSGNSIATTAGAVTARIHSSRFNKALNGSVTDLYSPTGMIVDTNTIVPTVII